VGVVILAGKTTIKAKKPLLCTILPYFCFFVNDAASSGLVECSGQVDVAEDYYYKEKTNL